MPPIRTRLVLTLTGFGLLLAATILTGPLIGSTHISLGRVFDRTIAFADNAIADEENDLLSDLAEGLGIEDARANELLDSVEADGSS